MSPTVLHLLSQRPSLTGSGVTLDALVREAAAAGWDQHVVVGVPTQDRRPQVADLEAGRIHPLVFGEGRLAFDLPGMSDVMPYPSTRFSGMSPDQLGAYRLALQHHVGRVVAKVRPDLIHSNHVWILSALLKDVAPKVPVVTHCHSTGLRQLRLCPHLAPEVISGCRRNDAFMALHAGVEAELVESVGIRADRILVVGAGYRQDLFHARKRPTSPGHQLVYIGKYSAAKGLPCLLDAVERLHARLPGLRLHVAGSGAGQEADGLRARMESMAPVVVLHGQLAQPDLAELMRACQVCVLPSFYEGLPLVLVEARACGCQIVSTRLSGVVELLAPSLGPALQCVPLPRLRQVDRPDPEDLPAFVDNLTRSIEAAFNKRPEPPGDSLETFTWRAVFGRIEAVWRGLSRKGRAR